MTYIKQNNLYAKTLTKFLVLYNVANKLLLIMSKFNGDEKNNMKRGHNLN